MMSDCSSIRMQSTSCCFTSVSDIPSSVAAAHSPPCKGGVAAPSKNGPIPKRRGRGGQFGQMFRPEDVAELTTPSAALRRLRDFLSMPQPPLLFKEGNKLA